MKQPSSDSNKVTDLSYLIELAKGDQHFMDEMIRIFLEENPNEIKMLEEGIAKENFGLINMAAHKLRSTLPFIGLDKLIEQQIQEVESLAANHSIQKLEISTDDGHNQPALEIITTEPKVIKRIEALFPLIKKICEQAREELKS